MNSETSNTAVNARKVQIDRMNTAGTEALYDARSSPDTEGIYPYVYNMKVEVDMKSTKLKGRQCIYCYPAR